MEDEGRSGRLVGSALLAIVGLVWFGQGMGWIPGSFMSGDPKWAWIGSAVVAVAVWNVVRGRKRE